VIRRILKYLRSEKHKSSAYPTQPQPCPHCNVESPRGFVRTDEHGYDSFWVQHGSPTCFASPSHGLMDVSVWTDHDEEVFRYWDKLCQEV